MMTTFKAIYNDIALLVTCETTQKAEWTKEAMKHEAKLNNETVKFERVD